MKIGSRRYDGPNYKDDNFEYDSVNQEEYNAS
jgi:hypothetical protein